MDAIRRFDAFDTIAKMREFIVLLVHSILTLVRLAKQRGLRSVVAESVLVRHQLLILNRGRKRALNLRPADHRWLVHSFHVAGPPLTLSHRFEAFHSPVFPLSVEATKVPRSDRTKISSMPLSND